MTRLQHTTFTLTRRRPGQQPEYGWGCNGCNEERDGYDSPEDSARDAAEHEQRHRHSRTA